MPKPYPEENDKSGNDLLNNGRKMIATLALPAGAASKISTTILFSIGKNDSAPNL